MKLNIERIQKSTSIKGVFFFDTMIWLNIVAPSFGGLNQREINYTNFFDKVYKGTSSKIAVSSVLFSELTNLYMRRVAVKLYETEENTTVNYNEYKTKYRPTQHFKEHYQIVCDEIESRSDSFVYCEDLASSYEATEACNYPKLDFNDFTYYQICRSSDYTLVTDDSDFYVKDIKILTLNDPLYKRQFER